MKWYSAHIVMFVELVDGRQESYPVWENIVLIAATTKDEAFAKASRHGHADEGDDSIRWGGKPARLVFAGVRMFVECEDADQRPNDGTEVTYHEWELDSREAVTKLVAGKPVRALLNDRFPETEAAEDGQEGESEREERKRD